MDLHNPLCCPALASLGLGSRRITRRAGFKETLRRARRVSSARRAIRCEPRPSDASPGQRAGRRERKSLFPSIFDALALRRNQRGCAASALPSPMPTSSSSAEPFVGSRPAQRVALRSTKTFASVTRASRSAPRSTSRACSSARSCATIHATRRAAGSTGVRCGKWKQSAVESPVCALCRLGSSAFSCGRIPLTPTRSPADAEFAERCCNASRTIDAPCLAP